MRRHGWALCLGALVAGSAAAQPPAGDERFPPAPHLPGQVVSQGPGSPAPVPPADPRDVAPAASPLPDALLAPTNTTLVAPAPVPMPCPPGGCPAPAKAGHKIGFWEVTDWLCFRSKSRQSAHFVTPYRPPLQAWFSCEPKKAPCGVAGAGCVGGPMGPVVPGPVLPGPGGPMPLPGPAPVVPISPEQPLAGGGAVGKCLDAEVLTTFQPVAPGLGFTPGAAPTANPTTQVKPTSFKPK